MSETPSSPVAPRPSPRSSQPSPTHRAPVGLTRDPVVVFLVRWGLIVAAITAGLLVFASLATLLWPALVAFAIAYLLDPVLEWLVARGMSRAGGARLLLLGFFGVIGGVIAMLVLFVPGQITSFINHQLPDMYAQATKYAKKWFELDLNEYLTTDRIKEVLTNTFGPVDHLAAVALGGVFAVLSLVVELLLMLLFAYYLLVEWPTITSGVVRMVPPRRRTWMLDLMSEIDDVVSGWVRGQAIVTTTLALLYAIAFWIIGVPLGLPLGLVVGALTIIPFIGTFVGLAVTGLVIALDWQGVGVAGSVGGVFVVLHLLEAAVLTPKIVGHKVGLSESAALFAVLAGGKLLGFVGIILAVPLAATVAVLLRHAVRRYEKSQFFGDEVDAIVPVTSAMALMMPEEAPAGTRRVASETDDDDPAGSAP